MSLETPEAAIDPKGGKADGISLTWGKLHRVTQADQCLSQPPLPLSLLPSGTFADSRLLLSFGRQKAGERPRKRKRREKQRKKNKKTIDRCARDVAASSVCFDLEE